MEKNIDVFNTDVQGRGEYVYSDFSRLSSRMATERQTSEIVAMLKTHIPTMSRILDVGCGDGTFTIELAKAFPACGIVGFDPASKAVAVARSKTVERFGSELLFEEGNIYDCSRRFAPGQFDVIVVRGVLHHLYEPTRAIEEISRIGSPILVLEPNGYNPMMKLIEKCSAYHRQHEEKSYWPPLLNKWFQRNHFDTVDQKYFSIVPYFCPDWLARVLRANETIFEKIPLIHKYYCGSNLVLYRRK